MSKFTYITNDVGTPCSADNHFTLTSAIFRGTTKAVLGQTKQSPEDLAQWESVAHGLIVGDYVLLEDGPRKGEHIEVDSVTNENKVVLVSEFTAAQTTRVWSKLEHDKMIATPTDKNELWIPITGPEVEEMITTVLREAVQQQADAPGDITHAQLKTKLENNPIRIELL